MYRAALPPVETTPAVREQLEPMICLGELLETVDVENSRKPTLRYCRTLRSPRLMFHLCSANEGEYYAGVWQQCDGSGQKQRPVPLLRLDTDFCRPFPAGKCDEANS